MVIWLKKHYEKCGYISEPGVLFLKNHGYEP
jgi:hypothetical protein